MAILEIKLPGATNVIDIRGVADQQFFLLLRKRMPSGTKITYEDRLFQQMDGKKVQGTTPDFHITKPDGAELFIEITMERFDGNGNDPKEKQKRIMSRIPDVKYTVLYFEHLVKIAGHNPDCLFFHGKKIRRNGSE
jgi:hypothetical protein